MLRPISVFRLGTQVALRSTTTRFAGPPTASPRASAGRFNTAAGPVVSSAATSESGNSPAACAARSVLSAVSIPAIPFAASPNSTSFFSRECGA